MRVLRLWVVINDSNMYDLDEEKPVMIEADHVPMKIIVNNGYHSSKPFLIQQPVDTPLYIEVGCTTDNVRLWGSIVSSMLLFALFFVTELQVILILANIPIFYLMYQFFGKHKEFITVSVLKIEGRKR